MDKDKLAEKKKYIQNIDSKFMCNLRNLLKKYQKDLKTDELELSEGLNISRPSIKDFMNGKNYLPDLSPGKIMNLWKFLTSPEKLEYINGVPKLSTKKRIYTDESSEDLRLIAGKNRKSLYDRGADEILIAAGFQPQKLKSIHVLENQYPQISQIVFLLGKEPFSQDLFFQITNQELSQLFDGKLNNSDSLEKQLEISIDGKLIELLNNSPLINEEQKDLIEKKYASATSKISKHNTMDQYEHGGLLTTILLNELTNHERIDTRLRITKYSATPISLELPKNENWNNLSKKIEMLIKEDLECLREINTEIDNGLFYSISKTSIVCSLGEGNDIHFNYTSSGTPLETAITSISLGMGFQQSIKSIKIEIKILGKKIKSLVKTTIIIENNDGLKYQGEWVESDLMQSLLQATILAGKKWVYYQREKLEIPLEKYQNLSNLLSQYRQEINNARSKFNSHEFYRLKTRDFKDIEIKVANCIQEIREDLFCSCSNQNELKKIFWSTFESNFTRLLIISKIHKLHMHNIEFVPYESNIEIDEIIAKFKEAEENLSEESYKILIPSKIFFEAERMLYALYSGTSYNYDDIKVGFFAERGSPLVDNDSINKKNQELLETHIKRGNSPNDAGFDVHQSLGYSTSIRGLWLLYNGNNTKDINTSFNYFLKSSSYFAKIGLIQKCAYALTMAGRAAIINNNEEDAVQCSNLAEEMIMRGSSDLYRRDFQLYTLSPLNLLKSERFLVFDNDPYKALEFALDSLRGSIWLGFNRRIADNFYLVSRCVKKIEVRSKEIIINKFKEIPNRADELIYKDRSSDVSKRAANNAIEVIRQVISSEDSGVDIANQFKTASAKIWHSWCIEHSNDNSALHPIGKKIQEEYSNFLLPIRDRK